MCIVHFLFIHVILLVWNKHDDKIIQIVASYPGLPRTRENKREKVKFIFASAGKANIIE